ncbi:MAG: hypothetical protein SGARI_005932 [Bacillariaceae sp.]
MMAAGMAIPERLIPTPVMKNYKWKDTSLISLDLTVGVQEGSATKGSEVISKHSGSAGSIAFVHGQQLAAAASGKELEGFDLFGVIKETGVVRAGNSVDGGLLLAKVCFPHLVFFPPQDDEGLAEFYNDYFPYPLYRDEKLDFYRAFEDGKITDSMSWSSILKPWKIYKEFKGMGKRLTKKNIKGNYKGEGLKSGGIVIFDASGTPQYAYKEQTGYELDMDDLLSAAQAVRDGVTTSANSSSEL